MSGLPSIRARIQDTGGPHVLVTVFAGPDAQHRANLGTLVARRDEAAALEQMFAGAGYEVEHLTPGAGTRAINDPKDTA